MRRRRERGTTPRTPVGSRRGLGAPGQRAACQTQHALIVLSLLALLGLVALSGVARSVATSERAAPDQDASVAEIVADTPPPTTPSPPGTAPGRYQEAFDGSEDISDPASEGFVPAGHLWGLPATYLAATPSATSCSLLSTPTPTPVSRRTPTPVPPPTPSPGSSARPAPTDTRVPTPGGSPSPTGLVADVGLDPGHSRRDVGATGDGLREFELTLDVAVRARRLLEARRVKVVLSRTDHNPVSAWSASDPTALIQQEQEARIRAVGSVRAYVSIHFNAFPDPRVCGTETYYNADNHGAESRKLAAHLQDGVVRRLSEAGYAPRDRGVKEDLAAGKPYGHFFSLRGSMPSALVEALFLSNPAEAAILSRETIREAIARGIADGVLAYLRS